MRARDAEEIAEFYLHEIADGVGRTGLRPGVIKAATGMVVSDLERKVLAGAAMAQKESGVAIITHTEHSRHGEVQQEIFAAHGLPYDGFVTFLPWQPASGFLGVLQRADVYLDTIGFSGFNTALYAVEAGLPIVCREGRFLRGRLASAIVKQLGLPELVTPTEEAYVELAVRLASDRAYRQSVRERMEKARSGLYEDPAPLRALEEFLLQARPPA